MWTCKLCAQSKNPQDMDECITCRRPRTFQPRQRLNAPHTRAAAPQPLHQSSPATQHSSTPQGVLAKADDQAAKGGIVALSGGLQLARTRRTRSGLEAFRVEPPASLIGYVWWVICSLFTIMFCMCRTCRRLRVDEQLQVENLDGISCVNGPGTAWANPFKRSVIVKAERLGGHEYLRIRDTLNCTERTVNGPQLVFLRPYERIEERGHGLNVSSSQYVLVQDKFSKEKRVQKGPMVWNPGPREEGEIKPCVRLSCTDYVSVQDNLTGQQRIEKGPCQWFPGPYDDWVIGHSIWLNSTQYLKVQDRKTGLLRIEKGPGQWFPGPFDEWEFGESVWLNSAEYVAVQDKSNGRRRIEKGPQKWFPEPYDEWEVASCLTLSSTQYIHVLDRDSGRTELVRGPCIWCPKPYDSPSAVKEAIVLQCDEYVNLKDTATGERWIQRGKGLLYLKPSWKIESSSRNNGIHKSQVLRAREYFRLKVAPHVRVSRPSADEADSRS